MQTFYFHQLIQVYNQGLEVYSLIKNLLFLYNILFVQVENSYFYLEIFQSRILIYHYYDNKSGYQYKCYNSTILQ